MNEERETLLALLADAREEIRLWLIAGDPTQHSTAYFVMEPGSRALLSRIDAALAAEPEAKG